MPVNKTLSGYLKGTGMSETDFARWLGAPVSSVHKWVHRGTLPSKKYMREIYSRTNGQLSPNDFYDLPNLPNVRFEEVA